ncbi:hypothetical protein JXB28_05245 [Candidatus Woesearchaeota archaeon]|nr:hypothetical protein [Candidatus Woesearchaeota archaeon]
MAKEHYKNVENKYFLYIAAIVLVVEAVAFLALMANNGPLLGQALSSGNLRGGAASTQAQYAYQSMQAGCVDSDNGAYYRTAGYVTYNNGKFYDNCVGSSLNEKYCDYNNNGELVLKTVNYRCKWGCQDGACVLI